MIDVWGVHVLRPVSFELASLFKILVFIFDVRFRFITLVAFQFWPYAAMRLLEGMFWGLKV